MSTEYGADQIQILEGLEAVSKETWNVHWKYVCERTCTIWYTKSWTTAVDEALAGYCTHIYRYRSIKTIPLP